jgi:hypothetical protein
MVEQREFKRVMAIVRAHARDALSKHDTQRASFLAYCRNNWKRYAAGLSRSAGECERFAAHMDSATRDLIALAEAAPSKDAVAQILYGEQPPAWADSIEGAMDSVIMNEAYQEPELPPEPVAAPSTRNGFATPEIEPTDAPVASAPLDLGPLPPAAEELVAEKEDRVTARYGFRSPAAEPETPTIKPPEHAPELQRKVRAVLLAHRPKSTD